MIIHSALTGHLDSRHRDEPLEDALRESDAGVPHQAPRVRARVRVLQVLSRRRRVGEGIVILEGVLVVILVGVVRLRAGVVVDVGVFPLQQRLKRLRRNKLPGRD